MFPIPSPMLADISNAPATSIRGVTGNPHSSFGRFIAFYNLCFLLLHCHTPSHSDTGVAIRLCLDLPLPLNGAARKSIYIYSKYYFQSSRDLHSYFKPTWCLGAIFFPESSTHILLPPWCLSVHCCKHVICHCAVILTCYCILSDRISVLSVSKDTKGWDMLH